MGIPIFCNVKKKKVEDGFEPEGLCPLDSLAEA